MTNKILNLDTFKIKNAVQLINFFKKNVPVLEKLIYLNFEKKIDNTFLKKDLTQSQLSQILEENKQHNFRSLVVYLENISFFYPKFKGKITTVIDFFEGKQNFDKKFEQILAAQKLGADEIDIVFSKKMLEKILNSEIYFENLKKFLNDIAILKTLKNNRFFTKIILEVSNLDSDFLFLIIQKFLQTNKIDCLKTSTGFSKNGATIEDVFIIKQAIENDKKVIIKASGGIKNFGDVVALSFFGADIFGTSSGKKIIEEQKNFLAKWQQQKNIILENLDKYLSFSNTIFLSKNSLKNLSNAGEKNY